MQKPAARYNIQFAQKVFNEKFVIMNFINALTEIAHEVIPTGLIVFAETDEQAQLNIQLPEQYKTDKEPITSILIEHNLINTTNDPSNIQVLTDTHIERNKTITYTYKKTPHTLNNFTIQTVQLFPKTSKTIVLFIPETHSQNLHIIQQTIQSLIKLIGIEKPNSKFSDSKNTTKNSGLNDSLGRKTTLEKLKQSEKRYRTLVNKTSDIFVQLDRNGNQVFISPVAEKITGYTLKELERPFLEVIHPADHQKVMELWQTALENPSVRHRVEYRHIHKTKGYIWVEAHGQSFLNDPEINSVYTFVRDISDRKKLEEELKTQKHRYQMISENVSDVIWVYNINKQQFTYISPSVKRLRGYTPEEAMTQSLHESLTEESAQKVINRIKEGLTAYHQNPEQTEDAIDELQQPCKNGKIIWVEASTRFRTNKNGEIEITGVSRNIEDKKATEKALRESEQRYRKLIETMNEGIVVHNGQKILSFNHAARQILGQNNLYVTLHEHINTKPNKRKQKHPITQSTNEALFYMCSLKNTQNHVFGLKEKNTIKWLKLNATPLPVDENGNIHTLITFDDITLLKEKEEKLEEANATKDRFISIMAHDLKGPFNVIMGYTELMNENIESNDFSSLSQMAAITNNSALSAVSLLNNLLDWSRSQSGKLTFNPEKINLHTTLQETTDYLENPAKQKNITINTDQLLCKQLFADKNMVSTILRNIISNAIKFSYKNGQINIKSQQFNNKCIISISDNGTGIPEKKISGLLSSDGNISTIGTNGEKGTGLGLTVCQDFVNKHNGRLWFETKENEGTTFFIELPVEQEN